MMLSCWIIDDEPLALDLLESYVQKTPFLKLTGKYSSALTAMHDLENQPVDIIFLDIQMPELDGLEFYNSSIPARESFHHRLPRICRRRLQSKCTRLFIKPISYADFLTAAKKPLIGSAWPQSSTNRREEKEKNRIFVKSEYKLVQVLLTISSTLKDSKITSKLCKTAPPHTHSHEYEKHGRILPRDRFLRVHRSYIVQKDKIENINKNRITIAGHEISIGETYRQNLMDEIG